MGSSFKWTTIAPFLASVSGFVSTFFALRANLDQSRTQRQRRAIIETVSAFLGIALVWVGGLFGLRRLALASPTNAGIIAIGAGAIGYKAYASLAATGWESAFSQGFSTAKEAAIGPIAHANEANNELAVSIANLSAADQSQGLILAMITLMVIIPVVIYAQAIRKRYGKAGRKLKSETADD